jgi:CO/xanthine dehydrogenase Mo-binding subunit
MTNNPPRDSHSDTHRANAEEQRPSVWGQATNQLDDWIAIEPDGTIVARSGKVELGTGVRTALAQIVAEELDAPLERIRMEMGDTVTTPNEGYTAGSKTIHMGGVALRNAAAEARAALLECAAERLHVALDALTIRDGVVFVASEPERSLSFAALMGGRRFNRQVTGTAPCKPPRDYHIVGTAIPRLDLLDKFTGHAPFVHNLRLPGMLHARVARSPRQTATLESLDTSAVRDAQVVRRGSFVAVVAEREYDAVRALRQLKLTWGHAIPLPPMEKLYAWLQQQPTRDQIVSEQGDVAAALGGAAARIEATYHQPFQAHASIGPSCALAQLRDGTLTVWCSSQGVYPLRATLADLVSLPAEHVHVIFMDASGCYGHNGADEVAADAAVLACEFAGRPVRVQWTREDEFAWEPKGPAMVMKQRAGLNERGEIVAWENEVWSPTHGRRPRRALDFVAGQLIHGNGEQSPVSFFLGGDRNAATNYTLANSRMLMHWLSEMPLRSSSLRSLGATANTFANESFMDELAAAAGSDPLAFRLRHLDDPRARAVLVAATERGGWGAALPPGEGLGLAFARYENDEAYVATVAHVRVDAATGVVQLLRVVVAHDCGLIINPDGLRNQIEGNAIQGASRALREEVRFAGAEITSLDWSTYPILTFSEIPEIEIVLINHPEEKSVGAGEPTTITIAPAIANAIYAATGARIRRVPFTPGRVSAALAHGQS